MHMLDVMHAPALVPTAAKRPQTSCLTAYHPRALLLTLAAALLGIDCQPLPTLQIPVC